VQRCPRAMVVVTLSHWLVVRRQTSTSITDRDDVDHFRINSHNAYGLRCKKGTLAEEETKEFC
jgi:hypothetical protein